MAKVFPFQPYRYSAQAGSPSELLTQPYDKIPPALQERYLASSPYNFVRLIKGKAAPGDDGSHNVYSRAQETLDQWVADGILVQDSEPGFYPYSQEFDHPETGERCLRRGFIGLVQLEEYANGVVHRHELTHKGPKQDRLDLTSATKSYFGQLFMLYDEPEQTIDAILHEATASEPLIDAEEQGVVHKLWKISDPEAISSIQSTMDSRKLLIADGHHRYETALAYSRENPEVPGADRCMMTFVNMSAEGLVVLPTHRVISELAGFDPAALRERLAPGFDLEQADSDDELIRRLEAAPNEQAVIAAAFKGEPGGWLISPKAGAEIASLADLPEREQRLDVAVLHRAVLGDGMGVTEEDVRDLKNIRYVRGAGNAIAEVRDGDGQAAFLLRAPAPLEIAEIAFAGGVMPQKSTDFYPKLLAGLTTYRFG